MFLLRQVLGDIQKEPPAGLGSFCNFALEGWLTLAWRITNVFVCGVPVL